MTPDDVFSAKIDQLPFFFGDKTQFFSVTINQNHLFLAKIEQNQFFQSKSTKTHLFRPKFAKTILFGNKPVLPANINQNQFFRSRLTKTIQNCPFSSVLIPSLYSGHRAEVRSTLAALSNYWITGVETARLAASKQAASKQLAPQGP